MKNAKIVASLILALLLALGLCACGTKEESNELTAAMNAEFPPFENFENGEYVGFEVDLLNEMAAIMGKTVVINNMEFDSVLVAVSSGNVDVGSSGLTVKESRKKSVDFTDSFYSVGQVLIVRADDDVFTGTTVEELEEQLKNKTVGACSGYTGASYIEGDADWGYAGIEGANLKLYDSASTGIIDLQNGNLDCFILDDAVARELASSDVNKDSIRVIDIALTYENYAMAVRKGNTELLEALNSALAQVKESGKMDELLAKWGLN